ncbi:MAG TPA: tripartite tricarboxylate transporter substrate binding protein [Reyranella sp.]|nr:tripartite tricarboxylate transporter substrate binding protein [Reyranella sp.]
MRRRTALALGFAGAFTRPGLAAEWPERPVKIVVPYAPGGPVDLVTRLVADKLAARFGQSFVVDNKPGANGAIGVQALLAAPNDGYTLLLHGSAGVTIYQAVMRSPAFDTLRDLAPITLVVYFDLILCANPAMPFSTVKEFVAYAKANPNKLSFGSAGVGAMNHVGTEWFKMMAGIDMVHVPYRGDAPVAADVAGGTLGVSFMASNVAIPLIKAGKLKPLAVPSRKRLAVLPDVPTMAEAGYPDFDLQPWTGLFGRAGLDKRIEARLSAAMKEILGERDVAERLAGLSMTPAYTTPAELEAMVRKSIELWKGVAAKAKVVVE